MFVFLFYREKENLWFFRTELIDCILYKATNKYAFEENSMDSLLNSIKEFFECIAAGCLLSPQSFVRNMAPHKMILEV